MTRPKYTKLIAGFAATYLFMTAFTTAAAVPMEYRLSPLAEGYLARGRAMTDGGNFSGALDQLRHLRDEDARLTPDEWREVAYLTALDAYERGDASCETLLAEYVARYPSSAEALEALLALGDYIFFNGRYADALEIYKSIDPKRLNASYKPLYTYREAFCLIKGGEFHEARQLLLDIRDERGYALAAKFYLAYIDYALGNYKAAAEGFRGVAADNHRETVHDGIRRRSMRFPDGLEADYYLAHIAYSQERYEEVIADALQLMKERPVKALMPELEKVTGLSYFKLGNYGQASHYLDKYFADTGTLPSDDAVYAAGVMAYANGNYQDAAQWLSRIAGGRNDIAQSAQLYLGQIAALEGDDNAAAMAFEKAASMLFDENVGETAMYDYIAAHTRGGNVPFRSSITLLERFLEMYPSSQYAPEVREYMATAYYNEKDYARALHSIERIPNPGKKVLAAKQKVTYELGIEALSNNRAAEAEKYFSTAASLSQCSPEIATQATLWLADALYSQKKWNAAEKSYRRFLDSSRRSDNRTLALYNMGYALYMQDKFPQAAKYFAQAADGSPALPQRLAADARMRLADCRYYTGDYHSAMKDYALLAKSDDNDADYAAYRHAVMRGLGGDIKGKIAELDALASRFPKSPWLPAALLEKGQTYNSLGRTSEATSAFETLSRRYPDSPQARKGLLSLAIAYGKADRTEEAVSAYREVIRNWPSSEEASVANEDLRRQYAASGELDQYSEFLSSIPGAPRIDDEEKEKLMFEAAETAYGADEKAYHRLQEYVRKYPHGRNIAQALLDLAEALENDGRATEALDTWRQLERTGNREFLPEAYAGIMRNSNNPTERLEYARRVYSSSGVTSDLSQEARLHEALALRDAGHPEEAARILAELSANPKTEAGAEAAVTLGELQLSQKLFKQAEKTLTAFTDAGTPHQYWLARGFLALADTYHRMGKAYLAKEYVTSLRDNYPGDEPDILEMIAKRLNAWK